MPGQKGDRELKVIVKGDVQGSVEALRDAIMKSSRKVSAVVIHTAVRRRRESDVMLAVASTRSSSALMSVGYQRGIWRSARKSTDPRCHSIIYEVIEDIMKA
jgi:translation initiation factor IF-2